MGEVRERRVRFLLTLRQRLKHASANMLARAISTSEMGDGIKFGID